MTQGRGKTCKLWRQDAGDERIGFCTACDPPRVCNYVIARDPPMLCLSIYNAQFEQTIDNQTIDEQHQDDFQHPTRRTMRGLNYQIPKKFWIIAGSVVIVPILLYSIWPLTTVPAGHRGVVTTFGKVDHNPLDEGIHFLAPWKKNTPVKVRTLKTVSKGDAASSDLQQVTTEIALNFHLESELVSKFFQKVGPGYESTVIDPAVEETFKAVTAKYTAEQLITKRDEVRKEIRSLLVARLREASLGAIVVEDFAITNFAFSNVFTKAIEAKSEAEQLALKSKRDLERIKIEAEQKIASAQAEATSLKLQKQEVTPELIKLRELEVKREAIKKWDGKLPHYNGAGPLPFLDVKQ